MTKDSHCVSYSNNLLHWTPSYFELNYNEAINLKLVCLKAESSEHYFYPSLGLLTNKSQPVSHFTPFNKILHDRNKGKFTVRKKS